MQVRSEPDQGWVAIRLDNDAEEASYVYDLVQSGRLQVENKENLPLPFRGQFLFKLPQLPRPIEIQVARFEPTAAEALAGNPGPKILVSGPKGQKQLLPELESALREVPPASEEELKPDAAAQQDEFARVRRMTFAQRIIFATRAGQSGRTVIMQQPSPLLLLYLLKNPLITLPEVVQIAKMPSIDALVAEYIVKLLRSNPQWAMSEELKVALVMNPKTPGGTALSLLGHLSPRSLREICKKGEVHGTLKNAALKILMERKA